MTVLFPLRQADKTNPYVLGLRFSVQHPRREHGPLRCFRLPLGV